MKIFLSNYEPTRPGGGWTFQRNLVKGASKFITEDYNKADVFFISSASMVDKETVRKAKDDGKKIVLRCDNIIRNSRNRNTGMSRMKLFSELADLVVFQSRFAEDLLNPFLKVHNSAVILNSIDEDIFNTSSRTTDSITRFLYSKYSSDETKNWEMARSTFQFIHTQMDAVLHLVGRFDGDMIEYNFDFYNGERFVFWGEVNDPLRMAEIYKNSDSFIYTYFNDACSNTLIEAMCCGLLIEDPYGMMSTGGAMEIINAYEEEGEEYFGLKRMCSEYIETIQEYL